MVKEGENKLQIFLFSQMLFSQVQEEYDVIFSLKHYCKIASFFETVKLYFELFCFQIS